MFCKKVLVYLALINFLIYFSSGEILERRIKRGDIDLQTCIDNFDVHKDKIIRTQDSQNMGAKYLNEIDLGSRDECLRLCCETDHCDVFVYEEKKSGSCYLFQCGPPEDFKCKFTHHVNYSSAVLAVNRHLPDLESQIKLTKHEQDLTKLRKPESEPEMIQPELLQQVQEIRTTPPTTTTTKIKEILPNILKSKSPEKMAVQRTSSIKPIERIVINNQELTDLKIDEEKFDQELTNKTWQTIHHHSIITSTIALSIVAGILLSILISYQIWKFK